MPVTTHYWAYAPYTITIIILYSEKTLIGFHIRISLLFYSLLMTQLDTPIDSLTEDLIKCREDAQRLVSSLSVLAFKCRYNANVSSEFVLVPAIFFMFRKNQCLVCITLILMQSRILEWFIE